MYYKLYNKNLKGIIKKNYKHLVKIFKKKIFEMNGFYSFYKIIIYRQFQQKYIIVQKVLNFFKKLFNF